MWCLVALAATVGRLAAVVTRGKVVCAQPEGVTVDAVLRLLRHPTRRCLSRRFCAECQINDDGRGSLL